MTFCIQIGSNYEGWEAKICLLSETFDQTAKEHRPFSAVFSGFEAQTVTSRRLSTNPNVNTIEFK